MADASQTDLRNRILEKLYVLIAGETADAEDAATVNKVIVSVNEKLREDEIAYWSDSAIPQHIMETLAAYMACFLANDYMDAGEARAFKEDRDTGMKASLAELRDLTATRKRVSLPTQNTHF
jgi:hypothetical protein